MVQVAAAAFDDAAQVVGPVEVPLLVGKHQVAVDVGHGKTVAQALQQVVGSAGQVDRLRQLLLRCDLDDRQDRCRNVRLVEPGRCLEFQRGLLEGGGGRGVGILRHRRAA